MDNIKKYINVKDIFVFIIDVIILVLIHFFILNLPFKFVDLMDFLWKLGLLDNLEKLFNIFFNIDIFMILLFLLFCLMELLHFIILPIYYWWLEKKSASKITKATIDFVKNSILNQVIIVGVFFLVYIFKLFDNIIIYDFFNKFIEGVLIDLYACYLFLFIYWYVEKKIKHYIKTRAIKKLKDNSGKI